MSLSSFESYLRTVPSEVDLHFSGFGEPWHAPEAAEMIRLAYEKGHRVAVFTTLDRANAEQISRLRNVRFKRFVVHLPDAFGEMRMRIDEKYLELLKSLARGAIGGVEFLTLGVPHQAVVQTIGRTPSTRRVHSRAANVQIASATIGEAFSREQIEARTTGTTLVCREDRMLANVLLPNGDLQFCSMDYGLEHCLGNLAAESYADILRGQNFTRIFELLNDPDSYVLCRRCEYALPGRYHAPAQFSHGGPRDDII